MHGRKNSLNVAVAAGMICGEIVRQIETTKSSVITHNEKNRRFEFRDSFVNYLLEGDVLNVVRTCTADSQRGKGVAGLIMADVFEYAKEKNLKIRPTCTYVETFVSKRPELREMIVKT